MKENKTVTETYIINGFKPFSQLAMEYFPCPSGVTASRKRMRDKIDQDAGDHCSMLGTSQNCDGNRLSERTRRNETLIFKNRKIELYILIYIVYYLYIYNNTVSVSRVFF